MIQRISKDKTRLRVHKRLRRKIKGDAGRPRLAVFRSLKHIYAQVIDDRQGRPTRLSFDPRPGTQDAKPREYVIKPWTYGEYQGALYREWEKANQDTVDKLSGGRIGYIHIRSMSQGELAKFEREFYSDCLDKDALIVDVRGNGGGNVSPI